DGIRDGHVTGVQTCALPISPTGQALGLYAGMNVSAPRSTISPFYSYNDSLNWVKGAHSLRFGFEIDRTKSISLNSGGAQTTRPRSEERRVGKECRDRWAQYE